MEQKGVQEKQYSYKKNHIYKSRTKHLYQAESQPNQKKKKKKKKEIAKKK